MVKENFGTRVEAAFAAASKADGLLKDEAVEVAALGRIYCDRLPKNRIRQAYYDDRIGVKNIGREVPRDVLAKVDTSCGWAAKAVDMVAARSLMDGYTVKPDDDGSDESQRKLDEIMADNAIDIAYTMAVTSELTHGCGFWTVTKGDALIAEPPVVINYHNAQTAASRYDYRRGMIRSCLIVDDLMELSHGDLVPMSLTLHLSDRYVLLDSDARGRWTVTDRVAHPMGRPLVVEMAYRPSAIQPLGKSRVSKTVRGITDSLKRELVRMEVHSESHASPQKYALDLSPEAYDAMMENGVGVYGSRMLMMEADQTTGVTPKLGMLQPSGVGDRISIMEWLARRMAAESSLPLSALGVAGNGYTSSDALRASSDDLIIEVEALNKTNGRAMETVAKMALAMERDKGLADLTEAERHLLVHWRDPSMPSIAQQADAMVKLASVPGGEFLVQTDFFWERAGARDEERNRIKADMRRYQAIATRDAIIEANR